MSGHLQRRVQCWGYDQTVLFTPSPRVPHIQWFSLSGQRSRAPRYSVNILNASPGGVPPWFPVSRPGSKLSVPLKLLTSVVVQALVSFDSFITKAETRSLQVLTLSQVHYKVLT